MPTVDSQGATPEAQAGVKVYPISIGWKILAALVLLSVIALWGMVLLSPSLEGETGDLGSMLFATGTVLFVLYAAASVFICRIELYPNKIRDVNVFISPELTVSEIKGFRIVPGPYSKTLVVLPTDPKRRKIMTALVMRGANEIIDWAHQNLTSLDQIDVENEIKDILSDSRLGATEGQRAETLVKARKWERILIISGLGVGFWALLWPVPYDYAILSSVLVSIVALGSLPYFNGALNFDGNYRSATPSIAGGFLMLTITLGFRGATDWDVLNWTNFWVPFTLLLVCLLWFLSKYASDLRKSYLSFGLVSLFIAVYSFGVIISLNGVLDSSSPMTHRATITEKRRTGGDTNTYILRISPCGPRVAEEEVDVAKSVYDRYEVGNEVEVLVRGGRFGIPWYYVR